MKQYDVLIIGGGAAGIMAAISAKRHYPEKTVAIVDRTFALGRKILIAGAGRCNITNVNLDDAVQEHFYGASVEFIDAVFKQLTRKDITAFFTELGIDLYVEQKTNIGKMFPVTNEAKTVTTLLEDELARLGVDIFLEYEVKRVKNFEFQNYKFEIEAQSIKENERTEMSTYICNALILAAGGRTYPALGSDGSGYTLAESLGHTIIQPVPSAVSLEAKSPLSHYLQGQKFEMEVTSIIDEKKVKTSTDDVMFKQYGLSGPAILNVSREISIHMNRDKKNNAFVSLNFFPGMDNHSLQQFLKERWAKRPDQTIEKSLMGIFPTKIPLTLLKLINIDESTPVARLTDKQINELCTTLTDYRVQVNATRGWNEAEFTAGGVDTEEIKIGTLESKLHNNLFFAGEVMNVDGDVGGFNLSWAWSSGYVAGKLVC